MSLLSREIAAYGRVRDDLETDHFGEWVVLHDERVAGTYEDFQDTAVDAVRCFGRGPYLIRRGGAPPLSLPASVTYRMVRGED